MDEADRLIAAIESETRATADSTGCAVVRPSVLGALRAVRRDLFVPEARRPAAWRNVPLSIGHRQTISQPFIVAIMTELLEPPADGVVLEVGTGSGYQTAILSRLVRHVNSIEIIPELAARAALALEAAGCRNVSLRVGDGAAGWPECAPFDRIIVTAAAGDGAPPALLEQIKPGGRMILPLGKPDGPQRLELVEKSETGVIRSRSVLDVMFVPMTSPAHEPG